MAEVQGKLTLEISDDYLTAFLLYSPNPEGKVWTLKGINDFLDQEGVTYGIDDNAVKKAFTLFSEGKGYKSDILAQGKKPELPHPAGLKLKESDIPEAIKPLMKKAIDEAPSPKIEEILEKTVKTPFKNEIQKQSIPVNVDSQIREQGYYRKGEEVGHYHEASEGKAGISVLGHNITPGKTRKNEKKFYLGSGLSKDKRNQVIADYNGILRKGKNWADLIPLNDHTLEISLSKDKSNCIMTLTPGLKYLPPPEVDFIYQQTEKLGYDHTLLLSSEMLQKYIRHIIKGGQKKSISISKTRDSKIDLIINETKTEASLFLEKGSGKGQNLNLAAVSKRINNSGLKGLNNNNLKEQISQFYNSSEQTIEIPLCKGFLPERGKDRSINYAVNFQPEDFVKKLKNYIADNPDLVSAYPSIKEFPVEKAEQMALVKKGDKLFSLGSLSAGKDGKDVFGNPIPGMRGNDPFLKLYEGIDYIEGQAKAEEDGIFETCYDEENTQLFGRIRQHKDSNISVSISENHMQAMVNIDLPTGSGLYADEERIKEALKQVKVIEGLLEEKIEEAAEACQKGEVLADFLVAEGKYPLDEENELRLFLDIDQQNKNTAPVKKSEKIGEIFKKTTDSAAGYTVLGEELESNGLDNIEIGKNITTEEDDETGVITLFAEASGQLFFDSNKIFIKDTLIIEGNLSSTMGKVIFPGTVEVRGSVQSQVLVKSGNNIFIEDVVESALLTAEGNIMIKRGVKGNKKAALHSQKSIQILYAEETNLMALIKIDVEKALLHCNIKCNGLLKTADNGKIIGGHIKVKEGLSTGNIGNKNGTRTTISFGQDYLVEDQIAQTEKDIQKIQEQMLKVDGIIQKIQEKGGKNEVLLEAREKKRKALKMMEKKNLKIFLLREKFEMHYESSIKIHDTLYPGTLFESHGRDLEINETLKSVEVYFDQSSGKISYRNL